MDMRKLAVFPTVLALALVGCGGTETADPPPAEETSAVPPPTSETTVSATLGEYEAATDLTYADGSLVDVNRPAPEGPWPVAVFVHGRGRVQRCDVLRQGARREWCSRVRRERVE